MNSLQHILFLDVETASQWPCYDDMGDHGKLLWKQKISPMARRDTHEWKADDYAASYKDRAAIYAEFGKVIVISAGVITNGGEEPVLRIKSFYGEDEKEILTAFAELMSRSFYDPNRHILCGHNIREFDIPYLCRRYAVHGIHLPFL